jgi:hypothetical protein
MTGYDYSAERARRLAGHPTNRKATNMTPHFSTAAELDTAIDATPGPKITLDGMKARITDIAFIKLGATTTLCSLTLDNGYGVRGESACVDPANYNQAIGEDLAFNNAVSKLWPLFGFLLAETRFQGAKS